MDPVRAADNIMTARTVIEEVALREELVATFMPKPFIEHPGSGMHTHLSLFEGEENAFSPRRASTVCPRRGGVSSRVSSPTRGTWLRSRTST